MSKWLVTFVFAFSLVGSDAQAQYTFYNIAWGSTAQQTKTLLQAQGYKYLTLDDDGDLAFVGPDGEQVWGVLSKGRLVGVLVSYEIGSDAKEVIADYMETRDTLVAILGEPHELGKLEDAWKSKGTEVRIWAELPTESDSVGRVMMNYRGPGYLAEITSRAPASGGSGYRELDRARWVIVREGDDSRTAIDRTNISNTASGIYRVWERTDFSELQRGEEGADYDAFMALVDYDCRNRRYRFVKITTYNNRTVVGSDDIPPAEQTWERIVPETVAETKIQGICKYVSSRR